MIVLNGGSYYPQSLEIDNHWLSKIKQNDKVGFIPAATQRSEHEYLEFFRKQMKYYKINNICLIDLYGDWDKDIGNVKVLFIAGGNTYKLMKAMNDSGFSEYLKENHTSKIIIGNSAGAVIFGQNLESSNSENINGDDITYGLGILSYSICPHYSVEKRDKLVKLSKKLGRKIVGLPETSGIIIDDSNHETIINNIEVFENNIEFRYP